MWFHKVKSMLKSQYDHSDQELDERTNAFIEREITLIFWGVILLVVLSAMLLSISFFLPENRRFERNSFGEGEKEIPLILEKDGEIKEYSLRLEEQSLSTAELNTLFDDFFKDLERNMKGKNPSLNKVTDSLIFDEDLDGYPFEISYEPEDIDCIGWDGKTGVSFRQLREGDTIITGILVTAEYGAYSRSKKYEIHLTKTEDKGKVSPFQKVIKRLQKREKDTRKDKTFLIPEAYGKVTIQRGNKDKTAWKILFLACVLVCLLPIYHYTNLKEKEKQCRKETIQDFPIIVHLLTLYMGAGLSFSSSVRRISEDYQKRQRNKEKKYAFEEIVRMDRQMRMGVSQKEACISWGKRFQETMYHKLSLILIQTISKGTREARVMMENAEKNAFLQRVERAKKEGEEAGTKLLFPMIILLCLVMILIMYPALIRFKGF